MQIFIGCAKTMTDIAPAGLPGVTLPEFQHDAENLAADLAACSPDELKAMLRVNKQLALENWHRYQNFFDPATRIPAVFGYDGMVFRKISPETMSKEDLLFANEHLRIGSFLYGLLRPLDLINRYRLEGDVTLPATDGNTLFDYWKPILTDRFIEQVKADDGILVNLASNEFKSLFDWKRVKKELTVITPEFKVYKDGKPKTVVIYAKMCRGAMTRMIIQHRMMQIDQLREFDYEGFRYESDWHFNMAEP